MGFEVSSHPEGAVSRLAIELIKSFPAGISIDYEALLVLNDSLISEEQLSVGDDVSAFAWLLSDAELASGNYYSYESGRLYWDLRLNAEGYTLLVESLLDNEINIAGLAKLISDRSLRQQLNIV